MSMEIKDNLSCFTPSVLEYVELQNSLSDLGQFSILASEYEEGIDYRGANYGDSGNTKGGTVIIDDSGDTRILKDGEKGFCQGARHPPLARQAPRRTLRA